MEGKDEPIELRRIQRPAGLGGFGRHAFRDLDGDGAPEILQLAASDDPLKLAAYSLTGDMLWEMDPSFPLKTGWADRIDFIEVMVNRRTGERRILALSSGNEFAIIASADGIVLDRPPIGDNNTSLSVAAWEHAGGDWNGCLFGQSDRLIGVDGRGEIVLSEHLPGGERFVSGVFPLRSSPGASRFLIWGTGRADRTVSYVLQIKRHADELVMKWEAVVDEDALLGQTALRPWRLADGRVLYPKAGVIGSRLDDDDRVCAALRLSLWNEAGVRVFEHDVLTLVGGGRFQQVLGGGAFEVVPGAGSGDDLILGWGEDVWLVRTK
jgi:hypothetical protein